MRLLPLALVVLVAAAAATSFYAANVGGHDIASLPTSRIAYPQGKESGIVILLSEAGGWSEREAGLSDALSQSGAVVVGVDLPEYYQALGQEERDCLYLVADIEELSRRIHRDRDMASYRAPVVAGIGAGGALALAIAAQTPSSTISATIAVDPEGSITLPQILCTPADKKIVDRGMSYGLTAGALPNPVHIAFTPQAGVAGQDHVETLRQTHPAIAVTSGGEDTTAALLAATRASLGQALAAGGSLDLPIVPIETRPTRDTMAIIYSGDGGWRDIDQKLGAYLQEEGLPVVGVDALRYFWQEKAPEQTAADLSRIIETYRARWNVRHVMLIGYSFGANILPATYRLLPENDRQAVTLVSLLALSHQADFEIAVSGWLGYAGAGKYGDPVDDLADMEPGKIQCIYGLEEEDTACPAVAEIPGADVQSRPGGHHFDGNYRALNGQILERLDQLLPKS